MQERVPQGSDMPQLTAGQEWRVNWLLVASAMAGLSFGAIPSATLGLFMDPLQQEFGWTRAQIMSGQMIAATIGVICAPLIGAAVDRFGPRRLGIAAGFVVPVCFALFGLTTDNIWVWRGLWAVYAVSTILLQPAIWTAAVTGFFTKGRGFALACVLCGSGFSSIVMPPFTYWAIETYGWRAGFAAIGGFWAALVIPLTLLFLTSVRDRDRKSGEAAMRR